MNCLKVFSRYADMLILIKVFNINGIKRLPVLFKLTFAYLLICTLLNGCLIEFPARQIIYSGGCFAYGNSRNRSSYQTVLK